MRTTTPTPSSTRPDRHHGAARALSRAAITIAIAASFATAACSGTAAPTAQSASATSRAPVAQGTHGLVKLAGEALGEVDLRPEQRAEIEQLAATAEARHAILRKDLRGVMLRIADQIEKGAVDKASLRPEIEAAIAKIDRTRPDDQAAIGKLHGILDDAQRAQFVDAFHERGKEKMHERRKGHPLLALAHDLGLSAEQRDKIRDAVRDGMEEAREHGARGEHGRGFRREKGASMLEAFKQPNFDPKTIGPQGSLVERAKGKEEAAFEVAEKVLPILTAEQRKILADKIRQRANLEDPIEGL